MALGTLQALLSQVPEEQQNFTVLVEVLELCFGQQQSMEAVGVFIANLCIIAKKGYVDYPAIYRKIWLGRRLSRP